MSGFDPEQKPSRQLWLFAGLSALALHVGGAAWAVAYLHEADPDDSFGIPAVEIGVEMAPHRDPADRPAGPDKDAAVASAAMPEQKAELRPSDLPKEQASEKDDPDRLVTPDKVSQSKDTELAKVETTASVESAAVDASAEPSSDALPEGRRAAAPTQGNGASALRQIAAWEKKLMHHLDRHKRFPSDHAQKRADIVVNFLLDRRGHVLSTSVVKGSGDAAFDEAAIAMVKRSDPVPPPPPEVTDKGLNVNLPVTFK